MAEQSDENKQAPWLKRLAHAGYAARGLVYLLIGGLALMAMFGGRRGETTGAKGALQQLQHVPAGGYIVAVVALGLVGYSVWRFIQGLLDADHHGSGPIGLAIRSALTLSAVVHLFLAFFALRMLVGWSFGSGGSSSLSAQVMARPYGRWVVGGVGLLIIVAGLAQATKGCRAGFLGYLDMPAKVRIWAVPLCRVGLTARGLVFCLIGIFVIIAAWQHDSSDSKGLGGVLSALWSQPYGVWLLIFVAVGLLLFGVYSFIEAGYRRVGPPRSIRQATPGD